MAHNLFNKRFVSLRQPAWHQLGLVLDKPVTAVEAFALAGPYETYLEKLVVPSQPSLAINKSAILRRPTPDDNETRVFGVVSNEYGLITPKQFLETWDEVIRKPIETLGALGYGETIFVSTKMPTYDLKGDEVEQYMIAGNPMTGIGKAFVRVSPVRVVCQNTLVASERAASLQHTIVHDNQAVARFRTWLESVWGEAVAKAETLREAFELLASVHVKAKQEVEFLERVYVQPSKPDVEPDTEDFAKWEAEVLGVLAKQQQVHALYHGEAKGSDSIAFRGTAWGLYNSVVEFEDYQVKSKARQERALFGRGAQVKAKAFDVALELVS